MVQSLNYDAVSAAGERLQPLSQGTLHGREQLLLRMFDFGEETWQFNILRFIREDAGWWFDVSSTRHLPVFAADLERQLAEAGFTGIRLLGGFAGAPFDAGTSDMLLAVAEP